ncbi:MAG: transposase [bacterium]|nr:transposase [Candidatus Kapabacteria bacterium]
MFRTKTEEPQGSIWLPTADIVTTPANAFYQKLDRALEAFSFGNRARALCAPFYCTDVSKGGYPGIDPAVYFKMMIVGFFENIPSERGIAARCADSLSIRQFLHYELTEPTPHHSSFTVIRKRLPVGVYYEIFSLALAALKKHKLLKGKNIGIDTSTIEANAALRNLEHRLTGESYEQYITNLAADAGVDPEDAAAVHRFDRKRKGRKTSNKDWKNPHDPDARIGRTKRGSMRMIFKPQHITDLDTGAILDVDVRPGDEYDPENLASKILGVENRINAAIGNEPDTVVIESVTGDKGYYNLEQLRALQSHGIRTIISDPLEKIRRLHMLSPDDLAVVRAAKRSTKSKYGKDLLKKRGMHLERSFEHVLDEGGGRRTTLRGRENTLKRYCLQALGFNLSLLMRTIFGIGTPKQALAFG